MSINQLYHAWQRRILQLHPGERITRVRNLAWLIAGIYRSKSVHLSKIALQIPGEAKTLSIVQRLSRFLQTLRLAFANGMNPLLEHVSISS